MGSVGKMRASVAALELQLQRTKDASRSERAAELQVLRHWRLQATCRYVGKSIGAKATRGGKEQQ